MSLKTIQERYRAGASLSAEDRKRLEEIISSEKDLFSLQSAIYLYGANFSKNEIVINKADHFIVAEPAPSITATCLKVLADFWGMHNIYQEELERFLEYSCYETWYDEVTVSVSFFLRNPDIQREVTKSKLLELEKQARVQGETSLLELFQSIKAAS